MLELILIDLSSIWWSSWHATADQDVSTAYETTVARVRRIADGRKHVAVCLDMPPYKRKAISAEYKAQRDTPPAAAVDQFRRVRERLEADGMLLWGAPGYEADDVIATATKIALAKGCEAIEIHTGDKDLAQLVSDRVTVVSVKTGDRMTPAEVLAKFGVGPDRVRDWLSLTGDTSDNIPGVQGVGPKRAAALITKFGDLDCLQSVIANGDPDNELGTPAIRTALLESAATIETARQLVTLHFDAPINFGQLFEERTVKQLVELQDAEFEDGEVAMNNQAESDDQPHPTPIVTHGEPVPEEKSAPRVAFQPAELTLAETSGGGGSTGLVIAKADMWQTALEPTSFAQAWTMAKAMFNSKMFGVANPEGALAIILKGRAMGIDAVTALTNFHVIEGRPTMHAALIIGLVKRSKACKFFQLVKTTDTEATWRTHRVGDPEPVELTWTIKDAERADLLRPSKSGKPTQWQKMPRTMLRWRAGVELARAVYPDITQGIYSTEEMLDVKEDKAA
jgi:5'-3' exonuclease